MLALARSAGLGELAEEHLSVLEAEPGQSRHPGRLILPSVSGGVYVVGSAGAPSGPGTERQLPSVRLSIASQPIRTLADIERFAP